MKAIFYTKIVVDKTMSRSLFREFAFLAAAIAVASCLVSAAPSVAAEDGSSEEGAQSVVVISGIDENSTIEEIVDFYSRASAESKVLGEQGAKVVIEDPVDHGEGFEHDVVDRMRGMFGPDVRMREGPGPIGGPDDRGMGGQPGPQPMGQPGPRWEQMPPAEPARDMQPVHEPVPEEPVRATESAEETVVEEPAKAEAEETETVRSAEVEISISDCDAGYDLDVIAAAVEAAQESDSEEAAESLQGLLDLQRRAEACNAAANLSCADVRNQKREQDADDEEDDDVEIVEDENEGESEPACGEDEAPESPGYVPGFMVEDSGETLLPASAYGALIGADL